jgi:hypothetical protein
MLRAAGIVKAMCPAASVAAGGGSRLALTPRASLASKTWRGLPGSASRWWPCRLTLASIRATPWPPAGSTVRGRQGRRDALLHGHAAGVPGAGIQRVGLDQRADGEHRQGLAGWARQLR